MTDRVALTDNERILFDRLAEYGQEEFARAMWIGDHLIAVETRLREAWFASPGDRSAAVAIVRDYRESLSRPAGGGEDRG